MKPDPRSYKKFVGAFGVLFLLIPCALMAFNYKVDPNLRYRFSVPESDLRMLARSSDKVLTLPDNYDDRALLKKFIPQAVPPEVVVIGGSRSFNVMPEFFTPDLRDTLLNVAVMAGTIRDYVALWQIIEQQGFTPKFVFICLEEQSMNSYSQNERYLSIYECYTAFFEEGASLRKQLLGVTTNIKDLFSLETTLASIRILQQGRRSYDKVRLSSLADYDTTLQGRMHSFTLLHPVAAEKRPAADTIPWGRDNGLGEVRVFEKWNRSDRRGYDHLIALIRRIKAKGARPVLVGMPYHPEAYRMIRQNPRAYENLLVFVRELSRISERENVFFYDAIEAHHMDYGMNDFLDGVHLRMNDIYRLFRDADQAAELGIVVDAFFRKDLEPDDES